MKFLALISITIGLTGCQNQISTQIAQTPYTTRLCNEIKFECLPEMADLSWQKLDKNNAQVEMMVIDDRMKEKIETLKNIISLTKEERLQAGITYLPSQQDYDLLHQLSVKDKLLEYEQDIEKYFPGYWGNTPKIIRYRWLRMAMVKAKKYNNDPQGPFPWAMTRLALRIGLRFDMDPKWDPIVNHIKTGPYHDYNENMSKATDYIDYAIFDKKTSEFGDELDLPSKLLKISDPKQTLATMKLQ